jgi:hypothetical protein
VTEIAAIPGLYVDLKRLPGGGYQIAAQHLRGGSEYEYWITIERAHVAAFAGALGADLSGIGDAWAAQVQEIAREGETTWLKRHGVPYGFSSWGEMSGF